MEPDEKAKFLTHGSFSCKPEDNTSKVKAFCQATGLPYSYPFVSIAILRDDESPCSSLAHIFGLDSGITAPVYATLKTSDEVIEAIELAANDDLNQCLDMLAQRHHRKVPYASLLTNVSDLRGLSKEARKARLLSLAREPGSHGYAEARLNRALLLEDVLHWGECGKQEGGVAATDSGADIVGYFH
jgi:hypothetical protein